MLRMIKGGLDSANPDRYSFIKGAVSDTRLMGVVAMHLAYYDEALEESFHQYYYYDYEELGLEHMVLLRSDDPVEVARETLKAFAGLGAMLVDINEKEGQYLAQWMVEDTIKKGQPLPPELEEVKFIYEVYSEDPKIKPAMAKTGLSEAELDALNAKMCVPIKSDYGVINYYLMRVFGKDDEGARLLLSKEADAGRAIEDVAPKKHSTFLKNKITLLDGSSQHKRYRCESILGLNDIETHHLVISELELYKRKIVSAKKISEEKISLFEAGVNLNKAEHVTIYELDTGMNEAGLSGAFEMLAPGFQRGPHEAGDMYIEFMPHNNHVEKRTFYLSDDVKNMYFVTKKGQIVLASYNLSNIMEGEDFLQKSPLARYIKPTAKYSFEASVIYDFAESGIARFEDFMELLDFR